MERKTLIICMVLIGIMIGTLFVLAVSDEEKDKVKDYIEKKYKDENGTVKFKVKAKDKSTKYKNLTHTAFEVEINDVDYTMFTTNANYQENVTAD